jgi:hypothetical protein
MLLSLKLNAKHLAEVLAQTVTGGALHTTTILWDEGLYCSQQTAAATAARVIKGV